MTRTCLSLIAAGSVVALLPPAAAQPPPSAFASIGTIETFTLVAPGTPLSGATITVNGTAITIPANLIVQMPASFLTPNDIFQMNPASRGGPAVSGLALDDLAALPPDAPARRLGAYEAKVIGNIVGGKHVAGLVYISQSSVAAGAGFIKSINTANGMMVVGADPAAPVAPTDARVQLNDPTGVYGVAITAPAAPDARFMVDTANPTVRAVTGYPMCVPRGAADALCPAVNRPLAGGKPLTTFVMGTAGLPSAPPGPPSAPVPPCPACDPAQQVPFTVGDYITYSGTLALAGAQRFVSAHTVIADVGIYTEPGAAQNYIVLDETRFGTIGPAAGLPPQETKDRFRVNGWSTNPAKSVVLYSIDINPASGTETLRFLMRVSPQGVPRGRLKLVVTERAGVVVPTAAPTFVAGGAPREVLARIETAALPELDGAPVPTGPVSANGLVAGQYRAPVGEFIFPEHLVAGTQVVPNNFECLAFLQLGSGPLTTRGLIGGPVVGRLAPWPGGPAAPAAVTCGP